MMTIPKPDQDWPAFIRTMNEFIVKNTVPMAPDLVPELKMYLASEITPIWRATESFFSDSNIKPPFWAFAWPGGLALARYILDNPAVVAGKRVFDFASGSGIMALAAKKAGAANVTANDIDPVSIVAIAMNASINNMVITTEHADAINRDMKGYDIIIAGDFCYEWPMAGYAIEWLRAQAASGITVLFADPGRPHAPRTGVEEVARYTIPTTREVEDSDHKVTIIYKLLPDEDE